MRQYLLQKKVFFKTIFEWEHIFLKGKIGFGGENQHRQKVGNYFYKSLHAEIHALKTFYKKTANKDISKYVIYIARLNAGFFGKAKPCLMCEKILIDIKIKTVFYTDYQKNKNVLCKMVLE